MKYLIIAAHGSRKESSNLEVIKLAGNLSGKLAGSYDNVVPAFLQFAEPLLSSQIDGVVSGGAQQVVIFPFFIGSGSHILKDIPALVGKARNRYPDVRFDVTRHLGGLEAIADVIVSEARSFA